MPGVRGEFPRQAVKDDDIKRRNDLGLKIDYKSGFREFSAGCKLEDLKNPIDYERVRRQLKTFSKQEGGTISWCIAKDAKGGADIETNELLLQLGEEAGLPARCVILRPEASLEELKVYAERVPQNASFMPIFNPLTPHSHFKELYEYAKKIADIMGMWAIRPPHANAFTNYFYLAKNHEDEILRAALGMANSPLDNRVLRTLLYANWGFDVFSFIDMESHKGGNPLEKRTAVWNYRKVPLFQNPQIPSHLHPGKGLIESLNMLEPSLRSKGLAASNLAQKNTELAAMPQTLTRAQLAAMIQ